MARRAPQDPDLVRRLLRARDRNRPRFARSSFRDRPRLSARSFQMTVAPAERWSIDRLAAVSGVSGAHFARSFKLAFGVPPHRYLLTLRLERAMAFLRDTDLPITDIALSSGWRSLGTFGRTFKDVVGVSPSAFRTRSRLSADQPGAVPVCFVRAATRPCLEMPVLEKRRRDRSDY